METWRTKIVCLVLCVGGALCVPSNLLREENDEDAIYMLPKGFLFGAGTSAYQTEGAWNEDGKGENVFDAYYHKLNRTKDTTGDEAADSYHRYKEDIGIAADLGLNVLRFSISWARIFKTGRRDSLNQLGVDHYHAVIDEMLRNKIEPLVTIYHFDHPQALQDEFDGWLGEQMPSIFADFADFLFEEYGAKVKYWLTINEAEQYCNLAGGMQWVPPMDMNTTERGNLCLHHLILGHAMAHKIYHDKYYTSQKGMVGFGVGPGFSRPATDSAEDVAAADRSNLEHGIGLSIEPLVYGNYPQAVRSDRPAFTSDEKELLSEIRIDFAGVNIYQGSNASASGGGDGPGGDGDGPPSGGGGGGGPPGGGGAADTSSKWTMRELPKWVAKRYNDLPVFFTESGTGGSSEDDWDTRAVYCSAFLRELAYGLNVEHTKVLGYTLWSFIDSFEFFNYEQGWGMVHVDYKSGTLKRSLKKSSAFFKRVGKTRKVPLVEAGSEPFPDTSGAACATWSLALTVIAFFSSRFLLGTCF